MSPTVRGRGFGTRRGVARESSSIAAVGRDGLRHQRSPLPCNGRRWAPRHRRYSSRRSLLPSVGRVLETPTICPPEVVIGPVEVVGRKYSDRHVTCGNASSNQGADLLLLPW